MQEQFSNRPSRFMLALVLVAAMSLPALAGDNNAGASEIHRIEQAGIAMLEAWYGGDPVKLDRVIHPDLAKRGVFVAADGTTRIIHMGKETFLAATREKVGLLPASEWEIHAEVLDVDQNIAVVKVISKYLVDVCQVAKVDGEWQVVNVLWYSRQTPPWAGKPSDQS